MGRLDPSDNELSLGSFARPAPPTNARIRRQVQAQSLDAREKTMNISCGKTPPWEKKETKQ